jgi:DNA-binding winged helix-turn-helix (wHTH) protein/tetratricopeptide (TPR) repeat protein
VPASRTIRFGRYCLHPTQGLKRGRQDVRITPKSLSVLRVLVERSEEVVTKEELFRTVWADTAVSDAALTSCIQELRQALQDDAREPRFIETIHRRGFRFLAPCSADGYGNGAQPGDSSPGRLAGSIVGRDAAITHLSHSAALARAGTRQVVFLTGEPGIGKTALVDAFLSRIGDQHEWRIARADCVAQYGAGEAYRPLLEALTRLCRQEDGEHGITLLRRYAPTWLAQLPAFQAPAEFSALRRRSVGVTRDRMLRELTDAVEAMSARGPIALCLEDLHWSDASTLDWIASFARRPERAAVLLIGTYRPGESESAALSPESIADGLRVRGLCTETALAPLDEQDVVDYLRARFPSAPDPDASLARLASLIYEHTEGNPFFIVNVLADLVTRGIVVPGEGGWIVREHVEARTLGIPVDIRKTIERQIDRLDDRERRLLEVASVLSGACSAAAIGAGAGERTSDVEAVLDALARRSAFVRRGPTLEWPDGAVSATFEFLHALYREVFGERTPPARRAELHRRIGLRLESAYGDRAPEVAAELAVHFDESRDLPRAVLYHQHAAQTDRRRSALHGAEQHFRRALDLLERLPSSDERDERELSLQTGLGGVLMQISGWGAPAVATAYERVRELCQRRGATPHVFPALWNLWIFYTARVRLDAACDLTVRLFELAHQSGDPAQLLQAHHAQWSTSFLMGDLPAAETHAREGIGLCQLDRCDPDTLAYGSHDTGVCARAHYARALALRGRPDAALATMSEAVALARDLDHPFTLAFALAHAAAVHQFRREAAPARDVAAAAHRIASEHCFPLLLTWSNCLLGWSVAELGEPSAGMSRLCEGLRIAEATGSEVYKPHWLALLAGVQARSGLIDEARRSIEAALEIRNRQGEGFYLAELYRLRGELRVLDDRDDGSRSLADADFGQALEIADTQGARLLFLRAAISRARHWRRLGRHADVRALLNQARAGLVEGHELPDGLDAAALSI